MNVGVKYAEKQERKFEPEKLREGRNIIGLQVLAPSSPGSCHCAERGGQGGQEGTQVPAGFGAQDIWL